MKYPSPHAWGTEEEDAMRHFAQSAASSLSLLASIMPAQPQLRTALRA
jgi:hypothetical protein